MGEETQAIFEMQQKKAIDSMNEMDRRDSDRKRMLADRRQQQKLSALRKKTESDERIQRAADEQAALENKKFQDYQEKNRLASERKRQEDLHKKIEREQQARELEDRRQRALQAKQLAAQNYKLKADKVLNKDREYALRRKQLKKEEKLKAAEEQAYLNEKRKKKKQAYDNMIQRQENKILQVEQHRLEQDQMQGRQNEKLDQEKEEKRIQDQLRDEDRRMAKERAKRREEHRRKKIEAERAAKNARADAIAFERERLKNERINSRIQGMKKRAEVAEMFEKLQVMGGGDMDKVEKTMAKKFGMKPINKEKLMSSNKKNRGSLSGNNGSCQRPSSAKPKRSKKMIKPLIGGNEEQGESIVSGGSSGSFTKVSQGNTRNVRERPSSAAPTRRSAKSASGRIRPSSSSRRKGRGRGKKNGGGGGKKNNGSSKSRQPDMTIEGIR